MSLIKDPIWSKSKICIEAEEAFQRSLQMGAFKDAEIKRTNYICHLWGGKPEKPVSKSMIEIIDCLLKSTTPMNVSDISEATGQPPRLVSRRVQDAVSAGVFVANSRHHNNHLYKINPRVHELIRKNRGV